MDERADVRAVVDAVCGRVLAPDAVGAPLTFRGRRWFFCGDAATGCRAAFKREPERWADARPEAGVPLEPPGLPRSREASPFRVSGAPLLVARGVAREEAAGGGGRDGEGGGSVS